MRTKRAPKSRMRLSRRGMVPEVRGLLASFLLCLSFRNGY